MAPSKRKKAQTEVSKLDSLLRQGAANKKVDIDKLMVKSNEQLLDEKIVFTKAAESFDSLRDFKDDKLIVLDASNEEAARLRTQKLLSYKGRIYNKGGKVIRKKKTKAKA